jgi:Holliday junction resolvase
MGSNQYRRGRRFEYEVKLHFESRGWLVFRTAGSHGIADLIAIKNNETLLIQCKYGTMPSKEERLKMAEINWGLGQNIETVLAYKKLYGKLTLFVITFDDKFGEVHKDHW